MKFMLDQMSCISPSIPNCNWLDLGQRSVEKAKGQGPQNLLAAQASLPTPARSANLGHGLGLLA